MSFKTETLRAKRELREAMLGGFQDIRDVLGTASQLGADVGHAKKCATMLLKHAKSRP